MKTKAPKSVAAAPLFALAENSQKLDAGLAAAAREAALFRLRQQRDALSVERHRIGYARGQRWAETFATYTQLEELDFWRDCKDEDDIAFPVLDIVNDPLPPRHPEGIVFGDEVPNVPCALGFITGALNVFDALDN